MNAIKRVSLCLGFALVCSVTVLAGETQCPPNPGETQCPPAPCVSSPVDYSPQGEPSTFASDVTDVVITEAAIGLLQGALLLF